MSQTAQLRPARATSTLAIFPRCRVSIKDVAVPDLDSRLFSPSQPPFLSLPLGLGISALPTPYRISPFDAILQAPHFRTANHERQLGLRTGF